MRQPSLAAEIKAQVVALLKEHYPDFQPLKYKTEAWSTGGSVVVTWLDGPSNEDIKTALKPLKEEYTSIQIGLDRRFTPSFLTHIAQEVCLREGWELPEIKCRPDGSGHAYIHTIVVEVQRTIYEQARQTRKEITTMASQTPLQSREDSTLEPIRAFALACWIQDFPQAVIGDVWKHEPTDQERAQGAVVRWQVSIYERAKDLNIHDMARYIVENYSPGDEDGASQARRSAKDYAAQAGGIHYHDIFIGQREDGSLFLSSRRDM